jgi:hypothetical protein
MVDRSAGIRSRFFFGCPDGSSDAKLDLDDLQIARLALKYARSKTIPSLDAEERRISRLARHADG